MRMPVSSSVWSDATSCGRWITLDGFPVQSEASPLACVTPIDTFPPARPAGLMAVGDERAISLIWAPSPEEDLGGYLIFAWSGVR